MKKYIQLYNQLINDIANNVLVSGARLPSEDELAETFAVSRQTVRQALALLKQEKRIYSVQGSGSFVASKESTLPKTKRIAVITTYFSEYIFPSILRGISDAVAGSGCTVEINTTNNSLSMERKILKSFLVDPVSGIIVEGTKAALPNPNISYYQELARAGIPIVFINSIYEPLVQEGFVSVLSDDYNGGYMLAKMAIEQGFRRIGCISKSDDSQGIARFSGIVSALADHNIDFDDRNFVWFTTETRGVLFQSTVVDNLISDCDAVLCYNDEVAELMVPNLKQYNHTVQFIGSFDANMNPYLFPDDIRFYSLEHPKDKLGWTAAQKLIGMVAGKQETSVVIPWKNMPSGEV